MNSLTRAVVQINRVMLKNVSTVTTSTPGTGLDISAYEGILAFTQIVGAVTGTSTLDAVIETSTVIGSGYVTAKKTDGNNAAFAQIDNTSNHIETIFIDEAALKQFVRWNPTVGGAGSPNYQVGCMVSAVKKYQ